MTSLVVLDLASPDAVARRLDIFPGGATPAVFPADEPFWVGYGFALDDAVADVSSSLDEEATRFELEVDGQPVAASVEMTREGDDVVRKCVVAVFPDGLPLGWHELAGRWYDQGRLLFASRADVEFIGR